MASRRCDHCGATVAAYPWFGSLGLVLLTWVLRSGSLAASAAGARRRIRGRKWYDGPLAVLTAPWYLVVATVVLIVASGAVNRRLNRHLEPELRSVFRFRPQFMR